MACAAGGVFFVWCLFVCVCVGGGGLHQVRNFDLSDSASIFTAEIRATINAVEQI